MKIKIRVRKNKRAVAATMESTIVSAPAISAPSINESFTEGF